VISFEPEIESSRDLLGSATADLLIARERRDVFSLHPELRFLAWAGASLLAAAAATFLANNRERIGPVVIAILIGLASAACYGFALWRRDRAAMIDDYVLLLGALLLSADVAFIESQFHVFDSSWTRHFLILALVHGITAYKLDSRMVLTLSITALAAWFGIEARPAVTFDAGASASRFFLAAGAVLVWTLIDRRFRPSRTFDRTFEHFAANLALLGAMTMVFDASLRTGGVVLALALAALVIVWGMRTDSEPFVLYAIIYAVVAVDVQVIDLVHDDALRLLFAMVSVIAALVLLFVVHARFRRLA
jgi:hypothetical protein